MIPQGLPEGARCSARMPRKAPKKASPKRKAARPSARTAKKSAKRPRAKIAPVFVHTDLATDDPKAMRAWCEEVVGWRFHATMPTPLGDIHFFRTAGNSGGVVRAANRPEMPGSIPYVAVADVDAAYAKARKAGAEEMMAPTRMGGLAFAIVRAPGGTPMGFFQV